MAVIHLIRELHDRGIRLSVAPGGNRLVAEGRLDDPLREKIRTHKPDLIAWLQGSADLIRRFEEAARLTRKTNPAVSESWRRDAHRLRQIACGERIND